MTPLENEFHSWIAVCKPVALSSNRCETSYNILLHSKEAAQQQEKETGWWMENLPKTCLEPLLTFSQVEQNGLTDDFLRWLAVLCALTYCWNGQRCLDSERRCKMQNNVYSRVIPNAVFLTLKSRLEFSPYFKTSFASLAGAVQMQPICHIQIGFHANLYWPLC